MQQIDLTTGGGSGAAQTSWITHLAYRVAWMNYGQSNNNGTNGQPVLTTTQPFANQMFQTGIRKKKTEEEEHTTSLAYTSFIPLVETTLDTTWGETGVAAGANYFVTKMASYAAYPNQGFRVLGCAGGQGGANMNTLSKGTSRWNEMIEMVTAGLGLSQAAGESFAYLFTHMRHGEADEQAGRTRAFYAQATTQLAEDIETTVRGITGQEFRPPFIIGQVASHLYTYTFTGGSSPKRPEIALAMRDAISENIFVAYARYAEDYAAAGLHASNNGHKQSGFYAARALAKILLARRNGTPVPPIAVDLKSVLWQDTIIDLEFTVPHGPLEFDTSYVSACVNQGFDIWSQDGETLLDIITSVTIDGPDRVRIVCASEPPVGAILSYAFGRPATDTTAGPASRVGGNLRDNEGDVDTWVDSTSTTRPLHNYCLIFECVKPS